MCSQLPADCEGTDYKELHRKEIEQNVKCISKTLLTFRQVRIGIGGTIRHLGLALYYSVELFS